jgi:HPt (histidine-containing phosphotransfer) domain-containing protein
MPMMEEPATATTAVQPTFSMALDQLWTKFLPQIIERIAILESAGDAHASGSLSLALCNNAADAAHKLAGILGSFGLGQGTVLAREAELSYSGVLATDTDTSERLKSLALQLRELVANR